MIHQIELGNTNYSQKRKLKSLIEKGEISLGGHEQFKIYGTLQCESGKRMKTENRVFFVSENEAINQGYRPCGHCLKSKYQKWLSEGRQLRVESFNCGAVINLLPNDGVVNYHGKALDQKAKEYFDRLLNTIEWKNDEVNIFGKHIITKRKVAWYGDAGISYTYSNTTKQALEWTKELLELKQIVEEVTSTKYNSCLLNLYHNGDEGMSWHSDDEKSLGENSIIASFSFGVERKFYFRHKKTKQTVSVLLEDGSLLVMKDTTQKNWLHALPKSKQIKRPRVNLTFRTIVG